MAKKVEYPNSFMKVMKKQKRKRIRKISINKNIIEKGFNNADRVL